MQKSKLFGSALALFYLILLYGFDDLLAQIHPLTLYAIELVIFIVSVFIYKKELTFKIEQVNKLVLGFTFSLIAGALVYQGAGLIGAEIPFDLKDRTIIFLLLVAAPILEEAIYRFVLWNPLKQWLKSDVWVIGVTSLLFAATHFSVLMQIPDSYKLFVLYQSAYVLFLGVYLGFFRVIQKTLLSPILLHFAFNLGFLLASIV